MTVRQKSVAEYPQKGQLQARTRSGTPFSREFSKIFPFQSTAWHPGHKNIPGDGNQPLSSQTALNTPAKETCADTDSATPYLAKTHSMSAEAASQSGCSPHQALAVGIHFGPSAKYLGKAVEPIYCSFSLSKTLKPLTKEPELLLRSCPALLGLES